MPGEHTLVYVTSVPNADGGARAVSDALRKRFDAVEVAVRTDVDACLDAVAESAVDAVVAALDLGDRTGVDLLESVREVDPTLPVVLYAADPSSDAVDAAYDAGATAVVQRAAEGSATLLARELADALSGDGLSAVDSPPADAHLEAIAETTAAGMLTIDEDSVVQFANPAIEDILGYAPGELLGEHLTTIMSDEDARAHLDAVQRYVETGERSFDWEYVELPGRRADGTEVPLAITFSEFVRGGERYFSGVVRDVTRKRERERELEERVAQQRAIAEFGRYAVGEQELDEVMDEAVDLVATVLDQDYCKVLDLEPSEDHLSLRAGVGWRDGLVGEATVGTERDSQAGYTLLRDEPVVVEDLASEDRFSGPDLLTSHDVTSGISVVVGSADDPWGILGTHDRSRRDYADHDVQFVQSIANTLASAVDRHRYERRVERHESMLETLNEQTQRYPEAEAADEVAALAVETVRRTLGDDVHAHVAFYDEDEGLLDRVAGADGTADFVANALLSGATGPAWTCYVEGESRVAEDVDQSGGAPPVERVAAFPLGAFGVLILVSTATEPFAAESLSLAKTIAATARATLERVEREADLRERRNELAERNEQLSRLDRVNRAIRDITKVLLQARTRAEVEQLVCEKLTDIEPYRFAWIGRRDGDEVAPTSSAGEGRGYLDHVTVTADETETGRGPAGRAVRTGEVQVLDDVVHGEEFGPWRDAALERGFRSVVAVPLRYRDARYGVLVVYADRHDVFESMEVAVLEELGETIGFAMSALERKSALESEHSVELEFEFPELTTPLLGFVDGSEGEFELVNAVERQDGYLHLFFTVSGADPDAVCERAERSPDVEAVHLVSDGDGGQDPLYEVSIASTTVPTTLVDRGAFVEELTVADGRARIRLRVSRDVDVGDLIDYFRAQFGEVELAARRERDEPVVTRRKFEADVRDRLSQREREVVRTAYASGFFEWPRESTGQDVADVLGVSQPTVNRHVRGAERTLFGLLFDDEADVGAGDAP